MDVVVGNVVFDTVGAVAFEVVSAGIVVETFVVGAVVLELVVGGNVVVLVEVVVVDASVEEVVVEVVVVVVGAIEFDSEETFVGINRSTDVPSPIAPYQLFPQQFRLPLLRSAQLWASPDVIAMTPLERPNT